MLLTFPGELEGHHTGSATGGSPSLPPISSYSRFFLSPLSPLSSPFCRASRFPRAVLIIRAAIK